MSLWQAPFLRRGLPVGSVPFREVALRPMEGMKTVLMTCLPYYFQKRPGQNLARFAALPDYHQVFGALLTEIAQELQQSFPELCFAAFTDNSPVRERDAAVRAGIAFRGRNGLCITPWGSFVFLGEVLTNGEAPPLSGGFTGDCGDCKRCLNACPTGALSEAGFAPERCLSALTQKKGDLTEEERAAIRNGGCAWGCDRCQECCPYNRDLPEAPITSSPGLRPTVTSAELSGLSDREFRKRYADRAFAWRGKAPLMRNLILTEQGSLCGKDRET